MSAIYDSTKSGSAGGFNIVRTNTNYDANSLDLIETDVTTGPITINAPTSGMFTVVDIVKLSSTNNITISRAGGIKIDGKDEDYIIDLNGGNVFFVYDIASLNWFVENNTDSITAVPTASQADVNSMLASDSYVTPNSLRGLPFVNENLIVDGNFDYWFEGTSQTASGYGSDTMSRNEHSGSSGTHSRLIITADEFATFDDFAQYGSRTAVTSVTGASNYKRKVFRFENVRRYSGRKCVFSFEGRATAADKPVAIEAVQSFGTGGSPSADVTAISPQIVTLGTVFAKKSVILDLPSISGKTLGTSENSYLDVIVWYDAGSSLASRTANLGQQSGTFDIAQVKLELGSVATPFVAPDPQQELARVNRYYSRTYCTLRSWASGASQFFENSVYFQTSMRAIPSVSLVAQGARLNATSISYLDIKANCLRFSASSLAAGDTYVLGDLIALDARLS